MNYFRMAGKVGVPFNDKIIILLIKLKTFPCIRPYLHTDIVHLLKALGGHRYYFHFTDEKTESQRANTARISPSVSLTLKPVFCTAGLEESRE